MKNPVAIETAVCKLEKRNGAWLIRWVGPRTTGVAADVLFECARDINAAKRIAVTGARALGYSGTEVWHTHTRYWYELEMNAD